MTTPLETEADALALPAVKAIYARARESSLPGAIPAGNLAVLRDALTAAGVTLGGFETRILLGWLPKWEPSTVAVVAGVIRRAYLSGLAAAAQAEAWGGRGPSASYAAWLADEDGTPAP